MFTKFPRWDITLWLVWIGMFAVLESLGIFRHGKDATLTYLVRNALPRWIVAATLGWLDWHFLIQKP